MALQAHLTIASLVRRARPDWFVVALLSCVAAASVVPCHGAGARVFSVLAVCAIASLFFLQGARLSREAIVAGIGNWRLHLTIAVTTFILFPLLGLALVTVFRGMLAPSLVAGVLFACVLPSTVQSSIALTSIASGNIAGAICAATGSNIVGIVLAPILLGLLLKFGSVTIDTRGIWNIVAELLVPFAAGNLLRRWIGQWADRNRAVLAVTDRGSILIVVYSAFSAAVVHGIWHQLPLAMLVELGLLEAAVLGAVLLVTTYGSRALAMPQPDEVAVVFCGSTKSLITGVPMAKALFAAPVAGLVILPIMIYHQMQLLTCAWIARRYARSIVGTDASMMKKAA